MLKKSHVGIARLRHPLNLGFKCEEVQFVLAVIAPKKEVWRGVGSNRYRFHFPRILEATYS